MPETVHLWMRLGADVQLSAETYKACQNDKEKIIEALKAAVLRGEYTLSGESYCPDEIALDTGIVKALNHMGEIHFLI